MQQYISNRELEELGEGIVLAYLKRKGIRYLPEKVDIEAVAKSYGFTVVYDTFAEDDPDKVGFLADGNTVLRIERNGKITGCPYRYGTIVLDTRLRSGEEKGKKNFTIAHELGHAVLDRYRPQPQFYRVFNGSQEYSIQQLKKHFSRQENEADKLAAAILMPYFVVEKALRKCHHGKKILIYGENVLMREERAVVSEMADLLGVSYTAMLIRLRQFHMLEHHPLPEFLEPMLAGGEHHG